MKAFAKKLWVAMCDLFAEIKWPGLRALFNKGLYYDLTEADHDHIRKLMTERYLVVLTRRKCHLTTYLIDIASWYVSKKSAHYAHALMNVEGDKALDGNIGHILIESTGTGVHFSTFMEVFDVDSVALLAPRGVSVDEWNTAMEYAKKQLGKGYDDFFDLSQNETLSCVELIYWALKQLPEYEQRFPNLNALLQKPNSRLTPQMLYDTGDFDIVFEVRR